MDDAEEIVVTERDGLRPTPAVTQNVRAGSP
jgi:hypothetical protein